jgi:predicted Rossmann-fold nucleotide-binding protein
MRYKIGIFGSSAGEIGKIIPKAHKLAKILAKENVIVITGAAQGLPYEVALEAAKNGAEIWGYSQFTSAKTEKETIPTLDFSIFKKIVYIPKNYEFASERFVAQKYRNVTSTATSDAGIIISGRWGSLNEFTDLYDMEKVIGILTGTGGIADELESLKKKIDKPKNSVMLFHNDPETLVKLVLEELSKRS